MTFIVRSAYNQYRSSKLILIENYGLANEWNNYWYYLFRKTWDMTTFIINTPSLTIDNWIIIRMICFIIINAIIIENIAMVTDSAILYFSRFIHIKVNNRIQNTFCFEIVLYKIDFQINGFPSSNLFSITMLLSTFNVQEGIALYYWLKGNFHSQTLYIFFY